MLLIETLRVVHTLVMLLYCQNKRKSSVTNNTEKKENNKKKSDKCLRKKKIVFNVPKTNKTKKTKINKNLLIFLKNKESKKKVIFINTQKKIK